MRELQFDVECRKVWVTDNGDGTFELATISIEDYLYQTGTCPECARSGVPDEETIWDDWGTWTLSELYDEFDDFIKDDGYSYRGELLKDLYSQDLPSVWNAIRTIEDFLS